jgi:glycogen debranching enzyme
MRAKNSVIYGDQDTRSSLFDDRHHVLMNGDTFAIFDRFGDFRSTGSFGLFYRDTRYLSFFRLRVNGQEPLLLSSAIRSDNAQLIVDLTNPELRTGNQSIQRGTLHIRRSKSLRQPVLSERIQVKNYGLEKCELKLSIEFAADFADIFEVRGVTRARRGRSLDPTMMPDGMRIGYEGLDKVIRTTVLRLSTAITEIRTSELCSVLRLEAGGSDEVSVSIECVSSSEPQHRSKFEMIDEKVEEPMAEETFWDCDVVTENPQFNAWLNRSKADLQMLISETGEGLYPYAGVPWYSTVFGRDGIITAIQTLWLKPQIARGVLRYLAKTQATSEDPWNNAQPGKIVHEIRQGEMAKLDEIPFRRYYGTVDATPLFLFLAAAYFERTGDRTFIRELWPNIEMALAWTDRYGDFDQDGFVEYSTESRGLTQQGWKDSADSVFHANGQIAEGPIALCEVQAYVFAAKKGLAAAARSLNESEVAQRLDRQADELRSAFHRAFWCEAIGMYALALDGKKRQCAVRSSNAGQCLFSGIGKPEFDDAMIKQLREPGFFSGWGVRTIASSEKNFNPMSYHNGSIWPHDNSLIAWGLVRRSEKKLVCRILASLFEAACLLHLQRLPELFCGFPRRLGEPPTLYPVACSPQAWASGSLFLLLQSCLGLHVSASGICFYYPTLPEPLSELYVSRLSVPGGSVDLAITQIGETVNVDVPKRTGHLEVTIIGPGRI